MKISQREAVRETPLIVVEEEQPPPQEAATPLPNETATPAVTEAVPTPTPEPNALDWLREHKDHWPQEVKMRETAEFAAKVNGRVVGTVQAPAGARVSLAMLEQKTVVVGYLGATKRVAISATDLEERAKAEMAKPMPTPTTVTAFETPAPMSRPLTAEEQAAEGRWNSQFKAGSGTMGQIMAAATGETEHLDGGHCTFTFHQQKNPDAGEKKIDAQCINSLEEATKIYNRYTRLKINLNVSYSAGTPTADCGLGGGMRLGGSRNTRTVLHEMGHAFGVGTHPKWLQLMVNGVWKGKHANKLLQKFTGKHDAELHGDRQHMWPYGLNYDAEVNSPEDMKRSALMVEAVVKDLEEAR